MNKSKHIRVAIKTPGKVLALETIPNTLKAFQQAVDGPIELIRPLWGELYLLDVFVNENPVGPPQQVMWTSHTEVTISGSVLIVHRADTHGDHTEDLTAEQIRALKRIFSRTP